MLRGSSFLLYILAIIDFCILGLFFASAIGAGENQGLAAGAIVLSYGVIFAGIALFIALLLASQLRSAQIKKINVFMLILLVICVLMITWKVKNKTDRADQAMHIKVIPASLHMELSQSPMGLGFYKPDFYNQPVIHFYGNVNLLKSLDEHSPLDSMGFKQNETGYSITYAPPWLFPEHMKMDYDILLFKVISISDDFIEVEVNQKDQRTFFVSRFSGKLIFWPEFLLSIGSVEPLDKENSNVRIKPLEQSDPVIQSYDFLKVLQVKGDWLMVELYTENYESKGKGWIKWKEDGKLKITYSLLS